MSLSKYEKLPDVLHKRVILDIAVRRIPERFIATEIFPERTVADIAYKYVKWMPEWKPAPSRKELAEAKVAPALPYEEVTGAGCIEYSTKFFVTDRELKLAMRDTIADRIETHSALIALRQEQIMMNELLTNADINAIPVLDWSVATNDILDHIQRGCEAVESETGVVPDTLIVSPTDFRYMLRNDAVRELVRGLVVERGLHIPVGSLLPHLDVFKELNKTDTTPLLSGYAFVLKRGVETGAFHVYEGLSTERWESRDPKGIWVRLWKTFGFDLFDPKKIARLDTAP